MEQSGNAQLFRALTLNDVESTIKSKKVSEDCYITAEEKEKLE